MSGHCFLGVDGGGSKTEFVCIDAAGRTRARHRTGPTYHLQVGIDGVGRALGEGLAAVTAQLGGGAAIGYTMVGLPAYGEDSAIDPALAALCTGLFGARHELANDMVCGWAGSLDCADGINLVAGTGSIGYGRRGDREARVGGWGEMFSDEGSAYWIAVQGLNAFSRMSDGRLAKGPLHAALIDALALRNELDLCARALGDGGLGRDGIAALAPIVVASAEAGDRVAQHILSTAAEELAAMATALRERLGYAPGERALLSWSGSVLGHVATLRTQLVQLLERRSIETRSPLFSPAEGAARLARANGQDHDRPLSDHR